MGKNLKFVQKSGSSGFGWLGRDRRTWPDRPGYLSSSSYYCRYSTCNG